MRFTLIDSRDAERARQADETREALHSEIAVLRGEITALKSGLNERPEVTADTALRRLEESFGAKIQDSQQQVADKLVLLDKRDAERSQKAEQIIAGFATEMANLKTDLLQRPALMTSSDPALRCLEENLSAKINELSQQVTQKFSVFESRDAELKELKDRSQSVIQRVAQLSAAIQGSSKLGTSRRSVRIGAARGKCRASAGSKRQGREPGRNSGSERKRTTRQTPGKDVGGNRARAGRA